MNVRQKSTSVEEVKVRSHTEAVLSLHNVLKEINTLHIILCYEGIVCLAEWLCVPSGKRINVGSNPAVGAIFFPARKTGVCYGYGAGVPLKPAANKYQALAWSPKQTQEFKLYPQALGRVAMRSVG